MNIDQTGKSYDNVFDGWRVKGFVNAGACGAVFRIFRQEAFGPIEECALKVIPIISESGTFQQMTRQAKEHYMKIRQQQCEHAVKEINLMHVLGGHPNVVAYSDYRIWDWKNETGFGTDLMIRMDFLKTLSDLQKIKTFSEEEIIQIGKDLCKALITCHHHSIIHRDIKPQNIFRNRVGIYQLGDFGIAKAVDMAKGANTATGTQAYAAPEQFSEKFYDATVDIYCLGLVLYEMCNGMKLPFEESSRSLAVAVKKRFQEGIVLPNAKYASRGMNAILHKTCAYYAKDRYQNAEELLAALEALEQDTEAPYDPTQNYNLNSLIHYAEDKNIADAQFHLAYWYYDGKKDMEKAIIWLKKAANNGNAAAQLNLGLFYIKGIAVKKNELEGIRWLTNAAQLGNSDAIYNLGRCYEDGIGVEQDAAFALVCYIQAANLGNKKAQKRLK